MRTLAAIGAGVLALVVVYWIDDQLAAARAKPLRAGGDCGCSDVDDLVGALEYAGFDVDTSESVRQRVALRQLVERVTQLEVDFNAHLDAAAEQARAELRPDDAEDSP